MIALYILGGLAALALLVYFVRKWFTPKPNPYLGEADPSNWRLGG